MGEDKNLVLEDRIIVPLVTPLKKGRFVDYSAIRTICERLQRKNINTVLVAGRTGGVETITDNQRVSMLNAVKGCFSGRILYCIGNPASEVREDSSHSGLYRVMSHLDNVVNEGAVDAVVVPTLFYSDEHSPGNTKPDARSYFRGILKRAKQANLPVILYNNPAMTGCWIQLGLAAELSADEHVLGIKDSSGSMEYFGKLLDIAFAEGADFKVYQGDEKRIAESIAMGADGIVPSLANLFPGLIAASVWKPELQPAVNEACADIYANYQKIIDGLLYGLSVLGIHERPDRIEAAQRLTAYEKIAIRRRVMFGFRHGLREKYGETG